MFDTSDGMGGGDEYAGGEEMAADDPAMGDVGGDFGGDFGGDY
jgi:hypothetical protein